MQKMSPFEFVNSINYSKKNIMVDEETEKCYKGYIVNRSLSNFSDTIMLANEMNFYYHLDNKLQYDFLRQIVRKRKRWKPKEKKEKMNEDLETIKEYYCYSTSKARDVQCLHSEEQIKSMKNALNRGGRK